MPQQNQMDAQTCQIILIGKKKINLLSNQNNVEFKDVMDVKILL